MNRRYTILGFVPIWLRRIFTAGLLPLLIPAIYSLLLPGCAKLNLFQEPPDHPVIDSINPAAGIVGTQLHVYGSGFGFSPAQDTLSINGVFLRVDSPVNSTVMLATIVSYTGTGKVHLRVNQQEADGPIFTMDTTIVAGQDPYLTSINPAGGWTDTVVTIRGLHFGSVPDPIVVNFGSQPATVKKRTDTLLIVAAPAPAGGAAGTVAVSVAVHNKISNSLSFTYINNIPPDPVLASLSPISGWTDTLVTIKGAHFGTDPNPIAVSFGTQPATVKQRTDTLLVVATPAPVGGQAGTVQVTVAVNGKTSNGLSFTYSPPVSAAHYIVSTVAGNGTQGYLDGPALSAEFDLAYYPAVDPSGNIYVSDQSESRIRKISPAGVVSTLAGTGASGFKDGPGDSAQFFNPRGITTDAQGNIYLADFSNNRIRKITPAGVVSTFAGGAFGYSDGPALTAKFLEPCGVTMDAQGNFFVADSYNNRIRMISAAGIVSTVAGNGTLGLTDGPAAIAQFQVPYGVAVDAQGNIYVADTYNNAVRKITPAGVVSTLAGNGQAGYIDGAGATAQFNYITGITIDSKGNLYVVDNGNNRIRLITPAGVVSTVAGSGPAGHVDGPGPTAQFSNPYGICIDAQGNLYVGQNAYIRKITIQ